jgi:hypothetical protein
VKEKNFQTLFGRHLKATNPVVSVVFELKICKDNKPFRFNQLDEQQEPFKEAYEQGKYDGYNKCVEDNNL